MPDSILAGTQFEAAENEKIAEEIIAAAVDSESISPRGAACLRAAVATFFGTAATSEIQPEIPNDAVD